MSGAIRLEMLGKPVAYIVADNFQHDADSAAEDNGMPGLQTVGIPAAEYYKKRISLQMITPLADRTVDHVLAALTRIKPAKSLAGLEDGAATLKAKPTLQFSDTTYEAALESFNQTFLDNHWGSGLPLIPPTAERLKWMLAGTSRDPNEVVGRIAPKNGIATIEKIAVNAVMAGARPEYLPVIITIMEAVSDPRFDLLHMTASTGSFSLQIMVNGPIAERIHLNSGIGLMGYGWRANNTIGHAVRLCLINLGHVWPAENDMALIGRPSSHTCHVFAENERQSPWPPYHVTRGYAPQSDCVTVATIATHSSIGGSTLLGGGAVEPWSAESILNKMIQLVSNSKHHMVLWKRGSAISSPPRFTFVLHPELAQELHLLGYDQAGLADYLFERTQMPYDGLTPEEVASLHRRLDDREIPSESIPVYRDGLQSGGKVPLLLAPDDCRFVVAGGIPGYSFVTSYFSVPPYSETAMITREISK